MRCLFTVSLAVAIIGICGAENARCLATTDPPVGINPADFQGDLDANRAKWEATGISSYSLKARRSCFCGPESRGPFDIIVISGSIASVRFSASSGLTGVVRNRDVLTIDGAFDKIQEVLNMDPPVASLTVSYDTEKGYITSFFVDFDVRIADEEAGYTFELLKVFSRRG